LKQKHSNHPQIKQNEELMRHWAVGCSENMKVLTLKSLGAEKL